MSVNKKLLSFELVEAQMVLELPDRELMHVRHHHKVVNDHDITARPSASVHCSHSSIGAAGGTVTANASAVGGTAIAANIGSPAIGGAGGHGVFHVSASCNDVHSVSIKTFNFSRIPQFGMALLRII